MTILLTGLRYIRLWLARILGRLSHYLTSEWRSPLFWVAVTALVVLLAEHVYQLNLNIRILPSEIWSQWWMILGVYTLILLFWWVWRARKRLVIEDFKDYTGDQPKADSKGLASLVVVKLAQLRELYWAVDEQRAIPTSVWVSQSIDATIKVEDVSEFLSDAVSAQSKFSLGSLEIPVGTLLSLIGRIVQGPRIIGGLHKDNDLLILTAQQVGGKQSFHWRVDHTVALTQSTEQVPSSLDDMVTELAYRMFTDLALGGTVKWEAMCSFSEGLRAYRDCLRTPRDRRLKLKEAEKRFIETLAEDQKFDLAYYNLGVVYTELQQTEVAKLAFLNAIKQNPSSWVARYALALSHFQSANEITRKKETEDKHKDAAYDPVFRLCERVIFLKSDSTSTLAKAYQLLGKAHFQLGNLKEASKKRRKAVRESWKALCGAELRGQSAAPTENSEMSQLETLASICLSDLAIVCSRWAKEFKDQGDKSKGIKRRYALLQGRYYYLGAKTLFKQALHLKRSDANSYAFYYFELGKLYCEWGESEDGLRELRTATRIIPDMIEFWAYLARAYAVVYEECNTKSDKDFALEEAIRACKEVLALAPEAPRRSFEEAFTEIATAHSKLGEGGKLPIEEMRKFLEKARETEENLMKGDLSFSQLEKQLSAYDCTDKEWEYAQVARTLGRLYGDATKREKACEYFKKPLERLEKKLKTYQGQDHEWEYAHVSHLLGTLYLDLNEPEQAERYFKEAIEKLEGQYSQEIRAQRLQTWLAYAFLNQGKTDDALQEVEQAISVDALNYFERAALGDIRFKLNDFENAIAAWKDALLRRNACMKEPDSPELHFKIGHAYFKLAQYRRELSRRNTEYQQATIYLKQAIELYPSNQRLKKLAAYYFLGYFYFALCDYEEAISYLSIAKMFKCAQLTSTFYLGYACLRNRRYDECIEKFLSLQKTAEEWVHGGKPIGEILENEFNSIGHITWGEMLALAYWGQAFAYAERNMNLDRAQELILEAEKQINQLKKDKSIEVQFPAKYPDCKGWILYKLDKIDEAIDCFKEALRETAHAEIYLHLALAYEGKAQEFQDSKNWTKAQSMVVKVRTCCQCVRELDINGQCEQGARDLLQRIQKKSQEVQQMKVQEQKQLE